MSKFLGRTLNFGLAKEGTRGTKETTVDYWVPLKSYGIDEKVDKAIDEAPIGVIERSGEVAILRKYTEGDVSVQLGVDSIGLAFYGLFGTCTTSAATPEASVYTHVFSVAQTVIHQSLSLFKKDGAYQKVYPLAMINSFKLDIDIGADEHLGADIGFLAQEGITDTSSPSYSAETVFVPRMAKIKIATNLAGLSAADELCIKKVSLNINQKVQGDYTFCGGTSMDDVNNLDMEVAGELTLNLADATYLNYMLNNDYKALRIEIEDTGTTIGLVTNPKITIDLAKVYFIDHKEDITFDELGSQTIGFIARYSSSDTEMIKATLINDIASY